MIKVTRISSKGFDLILSSEGFEPKPYLDTGGIPTIGFGTTRYPDGRKVSLSDPQITRAKGIEYLGHDIHPVELAVDAYCIDTINQNQFDALCSFAYNLGTNALRKSTLIKKVNQNPLNPTIYQEFLKWVYDNGRKQRGLVNRREAEAKLYFS